MRAIVEIAPAELASLSGVYEIPGVTKLTVTTDGDRLYVAAPALGPEPFEMLAQSHNRFFILSNGVTVDFTRQANGAIATGDQRSLGRRPGPAHASLGAIDS